MEVPLIATKLHIPRIRAKLVVRRRLFALLEEGLQRKVTLLVAPAGYGKTTCLSEWASRKREPVAWLSLDSADQDRMRFWRYCIGALGRAVPSFNEQRLQRLALSDPKGESLVTALLIECNRISEPIVLVWDDLHLIDNPLLMQEVNIFLHRLPANVHVYIASRTLPQLALTKLSAAEEAALLDIEVLRFTEEEANKLMTRISPIPFSQQVMNQFYERTEGWVTGIRLLVMSMSEGDDKVVQIRELVGSNRFVSDYFFEEVYARLPERLQQFMLRTSLLNRMNAELCAAVSGMADSAQLLQKLERMNLFLIALDQERNWYRYHHAFQQFLQTQFNEYDQRETASLHQAAGSWLEQSEYHYEAIEHYLASQSFEKSLKLVETLVPTLIKGEWTTLNHWLTRIPPEWLFSKPELYFIHIAVLYLSGQIEESTARYWWAEERLKHSLLELDEKERCIWQAGLAFLVAARAYIERDFPTFIEYSILYLSYRPAGDFLVGLGLGPDGRHLLWESLVTTNDLRQAEQVLQDIWKLWSGTENVYLIAHFAIDYGTLHYERNELHEAEVYYRKALDIGETGGNAYLTVMAAIGLASVYLASGVPERVDILLAGIRKQFTEDRYPMLADKLSWFDAVRAVRQGKLDVAIEWLEHSGLSFDDEIPALMLEQYNTAACIIAAQGNSTEAILLADRLLLMTRRLKRHRDIIRVLVHRSLILARGGNDLQSFITLEEALSLAEPDGYIRTFTDEGEALFELLNRYADARRTRRHRVKYPVSMSYVRKLLRVMIPSGKKLRPSANIQLTSQEQRILEQMAKGCSNREIATLLGISLVTVKTHINNMYRKLNVSGREEALLRWQQHIDRKT